MLCLSFSDTRVSAEMLAAEPEQKWCIRSSGDQMVIDIRCMKIDSDPLSAFSSWELLFAAFPVSFDMKEKYRVGANYNLGFQ